MGNVSVDDGPEGSGAPRAPIDDLRAERDALARENQLLRRALDMVSDGVVVVDPEHRPVLAKFAGDHVPSSFNATPEAVLQVIRSRLRTPAGTLLTPDERPLEQALRTGRVDDVEVVVDYKNGDRRTFMVTAERVDSPDGETIGAVAASR